MRNQIATASLKFGIACVGIAAGILMWNYFRGPALAPDADASAPVSSYLPVVTPTALDVWRGFSNAPASETARFCDDLPKKWMILCWDGADWATMLPLIEAGEMPNVATLMRNGVYGNLYTIQPTRSPVVWTSIATGVTPARHGILDFVKEENDERRLYSNEDRKSKALWNVLSEYGKTVLVVGYHNTYPAEPVAGLLASNYLFYRRIAELNHVHEQSQPFHEALIYPSQWLKDIVAFERSLESVTPDVLQSFLAVSEHANNAKVLHRLTFNEHAKTRWEGIQRSYLYDAIQFDIARHFMPHVRPDVMLLHFQSVDWASHFCLVFHKPEETFQRHWPDDVRRDLEEQRPIYQDTVSAFYRRLDGWLGSLMEQKDDTTAVMILSDHGFEQMPHPERYSWGHAGHDNAPPGILLANGPGIKSGHQVRDVSIYDILPTLMASLHLPVAQDLDGKIVEDMFCDKKTLQKTVYVPTYGALPFKTSTSEIPEAINQEIQEQLKSLGYIK